MNRHARPRRRAVLQQLALGALWPAGVRAQGSAPLALATAQGLWLLDPEHLDLGRRLDAAPPLGVTAIAVGTLAPPLLATADGQLLRIAPRTLAILARRDLGLPLRHAASSSDGGWLLVAPAAGDELLLFDADLQHLRTLPARTLDGRPLGATQSVRDLPHRRSFVAQFGGGGELWEISYDPRAEPIYDGQVHDFRMGEGLGKPGFLGARRSTFGAQAATASAWFAGPSAPWLAGLTGAPAQPLLTVWHLDVRRAIAALPVAATLQAAGAALISAGAQRLLAVPDRQQPQLALFDTAPWRALPPWALPAPALQVCAHPTRAQIALRCRPGSGRPDAVQVLDAATRQSVAWWPADAGELAGIAYAPDGRHLLALAAGTRPTLWLLDAQQLLPRRQFVLS